MSRVLDEVDQAVTITVKLAGIVTGLAVVVITVAATIIPPGELDTVCNHVWSRLKRRYFGEED